MTFADTCANAWTPDGVFGLIVGIVFVAWWSGLLDRWTDG